MTNIKFGLSQIEKETPKIVKYIYKTIQWAGTVLGILVLYLPIPMPIQLHITLGLLIGNKLLSSFCSMFGIQNPETTIIEKESVEAEPEIINNKEKEIVTPEPEIKLVAGKIDELTNINGI